MSASVSESPFVILVVIGSSGISKADHDHTMSDKISGCCMLPGTSPGTLQPMTDRTLVISPLVLRVSPYLDLTLSQGFWQNRLHVHLPETLRGDINLYIRGTVRVVRSIYDQSK